MKENYPIWHPFSVESEFAKKIKIIKGRNEFLYDEFGNKYVDLISSWWTNIHGHCNLKISKAISRQLKSLEHVIFADFTHDPAISLCNKLKTATNNNFQKFFFSDNGSTTIEVALKIAYQFWINKGISSKKTFISFDGNYHGDTFGSMSVGKNSGFFDKFKDLFFDVKFFNYPLTNSHIEKGVDEDKIIAEIENFLKINSNLVAGIILEPLVQGSSGMKFSSINFNNKIVELSKKYNIISIFDEVMTGFGRTGKMFAYQHLETIPDLICLSKGLTGGFLPLSLTGVSAKIYEAFCDENTEKAFLHGHSYTGNPIACAAANTSFDIFEEENVLDKIKKIENVYRSCKITFEKNSFIENFRFFGDICAFEIKDQDLKLISTLKVKFMENFLVIRPLKNTIYLIPPYSIKLKNLKDSIDKILNILINHFKV